MTQKTILVVAAHPDDEILGCGGTIARHTNSGDSVHILILAEGATSRQNERNVEAAERELEALRQSARQAATILGSAPTQFAGLPDNRLDGVELLDIIKTIEAVIEEIRPCTVYTHHGADLNIDHELVHRAVLTACRPLPDCSVCNIYTYETVSSTEWAGADTQNPFRPMRFVDISDNLDTKLEALEAYEAEMRPFPHARSYENVTSLARTRGASVGLRAAEAFGVAREILRQLK